MDEIELEYYHDGFSDVEQAFLKLAAKHFGFSRVVIYSGEKLTRHDPPHAHIRFYIEETDTALTGFFDFLNENLTANLEDCGWRNTNGDYYKVAVKQ